jgi:hypothetical protein
VPSDEKAFKGHDLGCGGNQMYDSGRHFARAEGSVSRLKRHRYLSIRLSEAGSNTTGNIIARRCTRRCASWTEIWCCGPL